MDWLEPHSGSSEAMTRGRSLIVACCVLLVLNPVAGQQPESVPSTNRVVPLVEGMLVRESRDGESMQTRVASVTLVLSADRRVAIVVDSPASTDFAGGEKMLKRLAALSNVSNFDINYCVITHGHPDHFGQSNFFPNADLFYGAFQSHNSRYKSIQLRHANRMAIGSGIHIWSTPGHTTDDISVVVEGVGEMGTVAIVGDLFYSEEDAESSGEEWSKDATNPSMGLYNRRRVLCNADYILPGHSRLFRVTQNMRTRERCARM